MNDSVLSVRNLSVEFTSKSGVIRVVNDLSFEVNAGETLAIVGESGSGKSVSSLSIMQLHNPERSVITGDIILNYDKTIINLLEQDLDQMRQYRGKAISMIFQEPMAALNPVLKCGEQVQEIISTHGVITDKEELQKEVIRLFREVELPRPEEMYDNYPFQLSGGQQQRVMIAMALANDPVLLIADEPTTALDPKVQDEILELISRLQERNKTALLFISHDLDAVRKVADKVVVMQNGEVKESGTAQEVFSNPQHPYTKGLLNCKPDESKKGKILPTVANFLADPNFTTKPLPPKEIGNVLMSMKNVSVVYQSGGLFKKKQEVIAIHDVNLELRKGETVGIIGPSGCGKTTTGRVLAGWVKPTSGEVLYNNVPMISPQLSPGKFWAREVQLIFQDPFGSLNPKIRIGDAIAEPMLVHGLASGKKEARVKVCELLEKVGLKAEHYDRYPHEFSGGQRQRIVIARALAVEPKVLVCDESVAALDVSVQAQVLNLLNHLQRELGLSYLFISHDHNVIGYFCDRIIEMEMGTVIDKAEVEVKGEEKVEVEVEARFEIKEGDAVVDELISDAAIAEEEPTPIWKQHLEPERTYDRISSAVNPGDSVADQVSAELLRMRLEADHKKLERLAEEIHIPIVEPSDEHLEEGLNEEEIPQAATPEEPEVVSEEEITLEEEIPETEAEIMNTAESELEEAEVGEPISEVIEEESGQPEIEIKEEITPNIDQPKSFKSLGDFLKKNQQ